MAKGKSTGFFCQNCGYESAKWMGQCPACREWNTFVEEPVGKSSGGHGNASVRREQVPEPVKLSGISTENSPRTSSGMKELDRVVGRRHCAWIPGFSGRRSRYWEIHPAAAGVQKTGRRREKNPLYFRRRVLAADQAAGRTDWGSGGRHASVV